MRIRPVRAADVEPLLAIYRPFVESTSVSFELEPPSAEAFGARIEEICREYPWLVAEDQTILGYAYGTRFRARAAYAQTVETSIYLAPEARGRGVAEPLYLALFEHLRHFHVAIAGITLPNPSSVRFHEKFGFKPIGVFPEVGHKFGQWHDVGFWWRPIGGRD